MTPPADASPNTVSLERRRQLVRMLLDAGAELEYKDKVTMLLVLLVLLVRLVLLVLTRSLLRFSGATRRCSSRAPCSAICSLWSCCWLAARSRTVSPRTR